MPKKPLPDIEQKRISFRVSIDDYIRLENAAAHVGLSPGQYARTVTFKHINDPSSNK